MLRLNFLYILYLFEVLDESSASVHYLLSIFRGQPRGARGMVGIGGPLVGG